MIAEKRVTMFSLDGRTNNRVEYVFHGSYITVNVVELGLGAMAIKSVVFNRIMAAFSEATGLQLDLHNVVKGHTSPNTNFVELRIPLINTSEERTVSFLHNGKDCIFLCRILNGVGVQVTLSEIFFAELGITSENQAVFFNVIRGYVSVKLGRPLETHHRIEWLDGRRRGTLTFYFSKSVSLEKTFCELEDLLK